MAKTGKKTKSRSRKSNNHGAAFVVGSLLGGLVGAVAALWSTPQSGAELRAKLSAAVPAGGGDSPTMNFSTVPASAPAPSEQAPVTRVEDPGDLPDTGIGHAATTEELTRPPDTTTTPTA